MRLRVDQLDAHLQKSLAPIYVVTGEEPLQAGEACDAIRARARALGYTAREVFHAETGFDWSTLIAAGSSLSLFADRRVLDLRLPTAKPGDAGARALAGYAQRPPEDVLLLISCGKLDAQQQRSKWFTALEAAGVVVAVWPVEPARLPDWVRRRMQAQGLQPDPGAVSLLAEQVEGNLLAAVQEIEKLGLLHGPGRIDAEAVQAAVADSARFDVFALADAALAGELARAVRILLGLRAEGVEPVLVLWSLVRELRTLAGAAFDLERGLGADQALARQHVREKRKPLLRKALQRNPLAVWRGLLQQAAHVDQVIKGAAAGNAWDELLQLTESLAGSPVWHRASGAAY